MNPIIQYIIIVLIVVLIYKIWVMGSGKNNEKSTQRKRHRKNTCKYKKSQNNDDDISELSDSYSQISYKSGSDEETLYTCSSPDMTNRSIKSIDGKNNSDKYVVNKNVMDCPKDVFLKDGETVNLDNNLKAMILDNKEYVDYYQTVEPPIGIDGYFDGQFTLYDKVNNTSRDAADPVDNINAYKYGDMQTSGMRVSEVFDKMTSMNRERCDNPDNDDIYSLDSVFLNTIIPKN